MPLGCASSPGIFQRCIEQLLVGVPTTKSFYDDILVAGKGVAHDQNLEQVLTTLQEKGLKLKLSKCELAKAEVKYLGFLINGSGLHNLPEVISAIKDAPAPTDIDQFRSFLGFVNQYSKFIRGCAAILAPLSSLLQKGAKWLWDKNCQSAFDSVKREFFAAGILVHYDPKLPLKLVCDASPYGIGAAIFHVFPSGEERLLLLPLAL